MKAFVFLALLGLALSVPRRQPDNDYNGAQVLRVVPSTLSQIHYLRGLMLSERFDFWTEPRMLGKPVDILSTRWVLPSLKGALVQQGMKYEIMVSDVQMRIDAFNRHHELSRSKSTKAMDWNSYHTYDEIMTWVDTLDETYPSLVTVSNVGTSFEGRTMKLVRVSTGGTGKPVIFVDGGIHAREWIAPATATYILNELLSNSASYQSILDLVDFYFMPSINPDGYSYTFTDDRLWRKTRSDTSNPSCQGVDPNRNWDYHWGESGASDLPCSDTYMGPVPFSEVECQVVRDQILAVAPSTYVYLTFHSYGQYFLYPWGYAAQLPTDWQDLENLANSAAAALQAVYGTRYSVGNSAILLYPAAGASDDWAKGVANIKYSYTMELRDSGTFGFLLPEGQIIPTGIETFEAFRVIAEFVRDTYGKK